MKRFKLMTTELSTTKELVKTILEENEEARNCDAKLVELVFEKLGYCKNSTQEVITDAIIRRIIPSYETITRCRRQAQKENPSLRANDFVEEKRLDRTADFIGMAIGG